MACKSFGRGQSLTPRSVPHFLQSPVYEVKGLQLYIQATANCHQPLGHRHYTRSNLSVQTYSLNLVVGQGKSRSSAVYEDIDKQNFETNLGI
jgi:hypothetical protein